MQLPKLLNSKFDTQHLSLPFFCNTTGTWFWRCVQPEGKWQLLGVYYLFIMSAPPPPRFEDRKACHHEEGGAVRYDAPRTSRIHLRRIDCLMMSQVASNKQR